MSPFMSRLRSRGVVTITFLCALSDANRCCQPLYWYVFCFLYRCGRGKQWKKALDMLAEMRAEGVAVNSFVYCSAIDACAKVRLYQYPDGSSVSEYSSGGEYSSGTLGRL